MTRRSHGKRKPKIVFLFLSLLLLSCFYFANNASFPDISYGKTTEEWDKKTQLEQKLDDLTENETGKTNQSNVKGTLAVHYIDVGQGDSTFIELPNNETILIDAGEKTAAEKIINEIKTLGYEKIDYIVATHPHADHIGGLSKVIETFSIGNIYMPKAVTTSKTYETLLQTILEKNLKVKIAKNGVNVIEQNDFKVFFLAPNSEAYEELNNYSAVLKITYHENSFLFMGDAQTESENEIQEDVKVNVIKVGHHGSDTSSSKDFVERVTPTYAVISAGKDNRYHHPHPSVVTRWQKSGAEILRTDECGDITMTSDGKTIHVEREKEE